MILAIFDLQVTRYFLASFASIGLSVEGKKLKIDFQYGHHSGHLGFVIQTILAILIYKSSYQISSPLAFQFRRSSKWIFLFFFSGDNLVHWHCIISAILVESHLGNIPMTDIGPEV